VENAKVIKLDRSEVESLDSVHKVKGMKRFVYPDFGVDFGFPDKQ